MAPEQTQQNILKVLSWIPFLLLLGGLFVGIAEWVSRSGESNTSRLEAARQCVSGTGGRARVEAAPQTPAARSINRTGVSE